MLDSFAACQLISPLVNGVKRTRNISRKISQTEFPDGFGSPSANGHYSSGDLCCSSSGYASGHSTYDSCASSCARGCPIPRDRGISDRFSCSCIRNVQLQPIWVCSAIRIWVQPAIRLWLRSAWHGSLLRLPAVRWLPRICSIWWLRSELCCLCGLLRSNDRSKRSTFCRWYSSSTLAECYCHSGVSF